MAVTPSREGPGLRFKEGVAHLGLRRYREQARAVCDEEGTAGQMACSVAAMSRLLKATIPSTGETVFFAYAKDGNASRKQREQAIAACGSQSRRQEMSDCLGELGWTFLDPDRVEAGEPPAVD